MSSQRTPRVGFTLVEFLICLTVLIVLTAITIRAVSPELDRSRVADDISRLRQIGIARGIYMSNFDEVSIYDSRPLAGLYAPTELFASKLDKSTRGGANHIAREEDYQKTNYRDSFLV